MRTEALVRRLRRVHRDESGTISVVSVFTVLLFTVLLSMLLNVARHVDDKLRLQNAADAAAFSGATTVARGMNALAFSNHLLAETFALTAYMREGEARGAESLVPDILDRWEELGPVFAESPFPKFARLGPAISNKVPLEREMVRLFGEMTAAQAAATLPAFEDVLQRRAIPQFQRAVVRATPALAQDATLEVARRYGADWTAQHEGAPLSAILWRAHTTAPYPVTGNDETAPLGRTLPAVDPSLFGPDRPDDFNNDGSDYYVRTARKQRDELAKHYLARWISDWMGPYFSYTNGVRVGWNRRNRPGRETAKMSQFINLWRGATCARLEELLDDEYRYDNLPHVYRRNQEGIARNELLERDQQFVAVAYWTQIGETFPGVFRNRIGGDALTFAQATVFVPRGMYTCCPWRTQVGVNRDGTPRWRINRTGWPQKWDLTNQNWMAKLVPATSESIPTLLQTTPPDLPGFQPPNTGGADLRQIDHVNFH